MRLPFFSQSPGIVIMGEITTLVSSIKAATEIAKFLKDSSEALEKAETKMKLADLISALADVKVESANLQQELLNKDRHIKELEDKLNQKQNLVFENSVYWNKENGQTDGPFCPQCFDSTGKVIRLQTTANEYWTCRTCNKGFRGSGYSPRNVNVIRR